MATGYTPLYKIMKGGEDITNHFDDRITQIKVELKGGNNAADTCAITVDDRDWAVEAVEVGVKIEIYLGYREVGLAQMGIFEVNTVDYEINPRQIKIIGNSVGFAGALKAPKIESFDKKTVGEIVGAIAKSGNVGSFIDPELAQQKIPFVNNTGSPLDLLGELERKYGAVAKFENQRLIFVKRDEGETASGISMPILEFQPEHFGTGFVRHTQRGEYSSVKVGWIDPDTHMKKYHEEENPNARRDSETGEVDENPFLSNKLGRTEGEAKFMAKSQMAALNRSMGEAHLNLAKGDPWIRDQMRIQLTGMRDKINGSYVIDTVGHTYVKDSGILTEIFAKPPGTGEEYESLDEKDFLKLGAGNVVGEYGPQLPDGVTPADPAPDPDPAPNVPIPV